MIRQNNRKDVVTMSTMYEFQMDSIAGESVSLDKFRDQVSLIVNVASQ